jgi:hypothetical protein
MKFKLFIASIIFSIASVASAQSVSLGYAQRVLKTGEQEHQTSISVKTQEYKGFSGDAGISTAQKDVANTLTNRYELGATYVQPITDKFSTDIRLATGWKAKSGSDTTTYYVIEPSVTAKLGDSPASVKLGYRVRNAWHAGVADNSETTRLALGYNITAKDKVSLGRDWQRGDGALTQTTLQYSRAF